jgi:hypothetical protein
MLSMTGASPQPARFFTENGAKGTRSGGICGERFSKRAEAIHRPFVIPPKAGIQLLLISGRKEEAGLPLSRE